MNIFRIKYFLLLFLGAISFIAYAQSSLKRTKTKDTISINLLAGKNAEIYSNKVQLKPYRVIDSLENILKKQKDDTNKVKLLNKVSYKLSILGKYDSSIAYAQRAETLAIKIRFKKGITHALTNLGKSYYDKNNYLKAIEYNFKSLALSQETDSNEEITADYGQIGLIYWKQGNYPKALEYEFKSLNTAQENGNKNDIALCFCSIGIIYSDQGNNVKALEYYLKALTILQQTNDKDAIAIDLGNIGDLYYDMNNYPKALEYNFKALTLAKEIGNKDVIASDLDNIGTVYSKQGDFSKALEYEFRALSIVQEIEDKDAITDLYINAGGIYTKLKKYKQAKTLLDSALVLSINTGNKKNTENTYSSLVKLDSVMGNYKTSYKDYKQYIVYHDSLINQESIRKITQMELNKEFQKVEDSIKREQEKITSIQEAGIKRKHLITNSVLVIILLAILLTILLVARLQIRRKKDKMLFEKTIVLSTQEKKRLKLERQKMEQELANAKALLNDYIKSMVEKNTLLEQYTIDIEEIKSLKTPEINDENSAEHLEHLNKSTILTEEDWNKFKELFEQVHKGFFIRLKEKLPNLTQGEIRFFCLLKLKLDTKKMSGILGVSISTIRQSRYLLRKKLAVPEKDDLNDIANSI